jgi:LuxR family transcriptional regulator
MSGQAEIQAKLVALQALTPAGYALAFHVRFTTPTFLFQTYDRKWLDHYSQHGYVMSDPTVHWGFENRGVCDWEDLKANDPADVLVAADAHGLKHGISWAIGDDSSHSLGSFARSDRKFTEDEIAELITIVTELHDLTNNLQALSPEMAAALKELSIMYTHPTND